MEKPTLYFRADGNSAIGLGHIFRLLAIVEMVKSHFNCIFLGRDITETVIPIIQKNCTYQQLPFFESYDAEAIYLKKTFNHQYFILDGYSFRTTYQNHLKSSKNKIVYLDDLQAFPIAADIVLNHAGGIDATQYTVSSQTQVFTGLKYAILRRPFLKAAQQKRIILNTNTAFVCFGGTDIHNYTLTVLNKLLNYSAIQKINVVIGQANVHRSTLENLANKYPKIQLLSNLNAGEMVEVMQSSAIAVCSSSTICYEYACVKGLLFVIQTADNQSGIYTYCITSGLAYPFEQFHLEYDIAQMVQRQSEIIDGKSEERICDMLKNLIQ